MSVGGAFTPTGNTIVITANSVAQAAVQCVSVTPGGNQYRILSNSSVTSFLGYGANAATALANAVVITSSNAAIPLLPVVDEILTFVPNAWFSAATAGGNATIYITPGDGV